VLGDRGGFLRRRPGSAINPDTGEQVTTVLDFPWRDGRRVNAVRVDYEPDGYTAVDT
jgi:hypothetical protein